MPVDVVRVSRVVDLEDVSPEAGSEARLEAMVEATAAALKECAEQVEARKRALREEGVLRRLSDAETVVGDPQWDAVDGKARVTVQGHLIYGQD